MRGEHFSNLLHNLMIILSILSILFNALSLFQTHTHSSYHSVSLSFFLSLSVFYSPSRSPHIHTHTLLIFRSLFLILISSLDWVASMSQRCEHAKRYNGKHPHRDYSRLWRTSRSTEEGTRKFMLNILKLYILRSCIIVFHNIYN